MIGNVDYIPYLTSPPSVSQQDDFDREVEKLPSAFALAQIFPNPFNPTTTIYYQVPKPGSQVRIAIFNVSGQLVNVLIDAYISSGFHSTLWNGIDDQGRSVASSVYFVKMTAGNFFDTKKIVLLK